MSTLERAVTSSRLAAKLGYLLSDIKHEANNASFDLEFNDDPKRLRRALQRIKKHAEEALRISK